MTVNQAAPRSPERTCLGCRARKSQAELRRVALTAGPGGLHVVWDPDRRFGGRGAWLCRLNRTCWTRALKKRAFGRAFRVGELLDVTAIEAALQAPEEEVAADVV